MSQITKTRIIDEEQRLQDLNTEANKVKLQITELLKEKDSLEKDILSKGSEFNSQLAKQDGELKLLAGKKDFLESSIQDVQNELSVLNTQKEELVGLITNSKNELEALETLKKSASESAEKSVQAKFEIEEKARKLLANASSIHSEAEEVLSKNNEEKKRLIDYDVSLQQREAKLSAEMAQIRQSHLELDTKLVEITDMEARITVEFDRIKKNVEETEALKVSAKTKEDLISSKLRNAKSIESEALTKKEAMAVQEQDLHNREREYNFKLSELQIKERALKIREKKFQLDE